MSSSHRNIPAIKIGQVLEHAENDFESKFGFRRGEWQISVSNPETTTCLQAVDYFLWAVQWFYEPREHPQNGTIVREDRYLNMLWPQIGEIHDLHHGPDGGTFYTNHNRPSLETTFPRKHESKKSREYRSPKALKARGRISFTAIRIIHKYF